MRIIIYAIPVILFAVLLTGPFYARDDGDDREDAAGQRENPGDADRNRPALDPEMESQLMAQPAPTPAQPKSGFAEPGSGPAAEPEREQALAQQGQPREAGGGWQVVRQRRRDAGRSRQEANPDQFARDLEAQREALLQRQAQQLERFLELQRRQYEALLEQQEQAGAAAGQQPELPAEQELRQTETQGELFVEQREWHEPDRDPRAVYGSEIRPSPDPYPDDGSYQGEFGETSNDTERYDDRHYDRRDTIEIPLPFRRTLRFWLR